ncbi:MAG: orotidine-5'-phosphate decarboxylase [Promethearchaeota archaeon]
MTEKNTTFSERLISQIRQKQSIICVGLDPRIREKSTIPEFLLQKNNNNYNDAIWEFNRRIIDATIPFTPIYKPQIAFYEKYNALDALKKTIAHIHEKGSLALLDAKRNDIGSTSAAYAHNVFDFLETDAVTVNSYFGIDGVQPFLNYVPKGKGVIVLLKTSNPSSGEFQDLFALELPDISPEITETKVNSVRVVRNYIHMARLMKKWSESPEIMHIDQPIDKDGFTSLGGVVGATYPTQLKAVRAEAPHNFILIPGYGAQGGKAEDIIQGVNDQGLGAIVSASRSINFAYQSTAYKAQFSEEEFDKAAGQAAEDMRDDIRGALESACKWKL